MKGFSFDGKVSGLMWAIIRIVSILFATILIATVVAGMFESWVIGILMSFVVLTTMIIAAPSFVNSVIKYLLDRTKVDNKALKYNGTIGTILTVVIITMVVSLVLSIIWGVLLWLVYSVNMNSFLVTGIIMVGYLLSIVFLYSWFVLHIYKMVIENTKIIE